MARLWDGTSASPSDKVSFAATGVIDDLATSGQLMVLQFVRVNNAESMFSIAKMGATTRGWGILIDNSVGAGSTYGHIRVVVGMSGGLKDVRAGSADDTTDTIVEDEHEVIGFTFDAEGESDGQSGVRIYRGPIETPVSEVSGYTLSATGSGTLGSDSADPLLIGDWDVNDTPFSGDIGWSLVVHKTGSTPFTAAEVQRCHQAMLHCLAGDEAFGLAMCNDIGTVAVLVDIESDGTIDDISANNLTGTLTGTDAGTEDSRWFAPVAKFYDSEPDATTDIIDQATHRYASPMATTKIVTTAQEYVAWWRRTLDDSGTDYDRMAGIGVVVDGVWSTQLASTDEGLESGSGSGLSAGSKTIEFVDGARSRPGGLPAEVSTVVLIRVPDASATMSTPADGTKTLAVYSESIWSVGFFANPAQRYGVGARIRLGAPAGIDSVVFTGYGGAELTEDGYSAGGRTDLTSKLTGPTNLAGVLIAVGVNDWGQDANLTTWGTNFEDTLDAIVAATTDEPIMVIGPIDHSLWGTGNGNGDTIADFRDAMSTAVTNVGLSRVTFHDPGPDGDAVLTEPTDYFDGTHPDENGHEDLYDWIAPILESKLGGINVLRRRISGE